MDVLAKNMVLTSPLGVKLECRVAAQHMSRMQVALYEYFPTAVSALFEEASDVKWLLRIKNKIVVRS